MKKIKFLEKFGPGLSIAKLDELTGNYQLSMPSQIRQILQQANGGRPKNTVFSIIGLADNEYGEIDYFHGAGDHVVDDLFWYADVYKGRIPEELFAFAGDGSGNQLCLVVAGSRVGEVVFWDHEGEVDSSTWENVYKVACSFDAFIDSLKEYSDEDD